MKIIFNAILPYKPYNSSKNRTLLPLKYDTVSFGSMKKSQFQGLDLFAVEKYKAPIEKFYTNEDLQNWAKTKYEQILNKDFGGRYGDIKELRKQTINEWANYIINENDAYTNTHRLIILDGITKDLGYKDEKMPPVLNKGVLAKTIDELDKKIKLNPKIQFNFNKVYAYNLVNQSEEKTSTGVNGWIEIPSKEHDEENFESNVEKLKTLSHNNWCTKTLNAEPYLEKGDFHVYLVNGEPKVGVRFTGDKIAEIQGEKNDCRIPSAYYDIIAEHIAEKQLQYNNEVEWYLNKAKENSEKFKQIQEIVQNSKIDSNDTEKIFEIMDIKYKKDKDGLYIISHYKTDFTDGDFTIQDLGFKESKILDRVKEIKGDANFAGSNLHIFKTLKKISGDANLNMSQIENLGSLEEVGGRLFFSKSIKDLGNLRKIGGDFNDYGHKLKSLQNVEEIGGDVRIEECINPVFDDFGKLKKIGGALIIGHKAIIDNLGNIEEIGSTLNIYESTKIKTLAHIKRIGEDARVNTGLKDFGEIEEIGSTISFRVFHSPDKPEISEEERLKIKSAIYSVKKHGLRDYQKQSMINHINKFIKQQDYYGWKTWFDMKLNYMTLSQIDELNITQYIQAKDEKTKNEIIAEYNKERAKRN